MRAAPGIRPAAPPRHGPRGINHLAPSVKTVFLGTSGFAVAVLERLAAGAHRPALVITRPDAPRGRGRRLAPPPVAEAARRLGLELLQPERLHDDAVLERIAA